MGFCFIIYNLDLMKDSSDFPVWAIPFIIVYLLGMIFSSRWAYLDKKMPWWKKMLFVVFWPLFLIAAIIKIATL